MADVLKEDININVISLDVLIKLLGKREFYANIISDVKANNITVIENMNIGFEKLAVAINNVSVSSSQTIGDLFNKLDTLTSCNI